METVDDIVKEIREIAHNISVADERTLSLFRPVTALSRIADRLDAAYKRDMQAIVDANETAMKTAMDEVERLIAALKPVLEFNLDCHLCDGYCALVEKVKESQRIYNGGAK